MAMEINAKNFNEEVMKASKPVLVDFWATWCGPCKMLTPTIEELAKDFEGQATIGKLDVDDNQELAAQYNVMGVPTVLIFKAGVVVEQFVGVQSKGVYANAIKKHF